MQFQICSEIPLVIDGKFKGAVDQSTAPVSFYFFFSIFIPIAYTEKAITTSKG